jgi:hypothetical protein
VISALVSKNLGMAGGSMNKNKIFIIIILVFFCLASQSNFLEARNRKSGLAKKNKRVKHKAIQTGVDVKFSSAIAKFFEEGFFDRKNLENKSEYIWQTKAKGPFSELILSWNAFRPQRYGKFSFFVSVKHHNWSNWYKIAEWSSTSQQTFGYAKNPFVHCKYVRVELKKRKAEEFKIKVRAEKGAALKDLKALFVCLSDLDKFCINKPNKNFDSVVIKGVPVQSQMRVNHPRRCDLCSPTSLSMLVKYFAGYEKIEESLKDYVPMFAKRVHDDGPLNIYGNWSLNVAQAYESTNGDVFFRVQRLNGFNELYHYLNKKIPIAVSVRGPLKGAKSKYSKGHFMVVAGWDKKKQNLLCIDPAFSSNRKTMHAYKIDSFLQAWGASRNLSYVALPKEELSKKIVLNSSSVN